MKTEVKNIRSSRRGSQQGMSLVELMVAITLGIFLVWGVTQSFLTSKRVYRLQEGMARIQENGRLAQEFLGYDIRNAGDYGCANGDDFLLGTSTVSPDARNDTTCTTSPSLNPGTGRNMISATTSLDEEFEFAVYGFDNCTSGGATCNIGTSTTTLTASVPASAGGGSPTATLSMPVKAGTDVLMVHTSQDLGVVTGATSSPDNSLGTPLTSYQNFSAFTISTSAKFVNSAVQKDRLAVSDCGTVRIFGVQDMSSASQTLTLADNFCSVAAYAANPTARMLDTVYYFVAANGHGGYSLYRQTGGYSQSVAQELLDGVEDMQLTYGIDYTPVPNDFVVDAYYPAGDSTFTASTWPSAWDGWDWDGTNSRRESTLVRAVRYSLLMRTTDDNVVQDYQTYSFNNNSVTATDHRLREVFSGTVGIRSRTLIQ